MKHALSSSLFSVLTRDEDKTIIQTNTETLAKEKDKDEDLTMLSRANLSPSPLHAKPQEIEADACAEPAHAETTHIETLSDDEDIVQFRRYFNAFLQQLSTIILDKENVLRFVITSLIAGGHILLEDEPGTGKTKLAKSIAQCIHAPFRRIQCTPDMLPSDITGVPWYNQKTGEFEFKKGPIFASLVLIDEINRASAKTQSALLEVMEEGQVTLDGVSYSVPEPFIVIATQNTHDQLGTFQLPEAQLDRFFMRLSLGIPSKETSIRILQQLNYENSSAISSSTINTKTIQYMRDTAQKVHIDTVLLSYIITLIYHIRTNTYVSAGPSIRSAIALVHASRIWAASQGRDYVIPDDITALVEAIVAHRITLTTQVQHDEYTSSNVIAQALQTISVPEYGSKHNLECRSKYDSKSAD